MTSPWNEATLESYSDTEFQPFAEAPFAGESWREALAATEQEWDSPFAPAAREAFMEYGTEAYSGSPEAEWGQESEWGSPFTSESPVTESWSEVMRTLDQFPKTCDDVTFDGKPWPFGKIDANNNGRVSDLTRVPRAEVFEFSLSQFDVDRHELKRQHRDAIANFARLVQAGIKENRFTNDPIKVFAYGEASSTAAAIHNLPLSRNRAFNTLNAIRCEFQKQGIARTVEYGFYSTGEEHARVTGPDSKENPQFRRVLVRAFAAIQPCKCDPRRPPYRPPHRRPTESAICASIPQIRPRVRTKLPPDIIPLGPLVPGLRMPFAIVTRAEATIKIDERRGHQSGLYAFQGWGLEVALPTGRTRIDIQADLKASLEILVRASASLSGRLQLGPLGLTLRLDASAFAQLIVKVAAQLRIRLDIDLGRPNLPEIRVCRPLPVRAANGPFPFAVLSGPAFILVPGPGYGPAFLRLGDAGAAAIGLTTNPIPVPADKSTVRTLLALGGSMRLTRTVGGATREAESEWPEAETSEAEWPEAEAEWPEAEALDEASWPEAMEYEREVVGAV